MKRLLRLKGESDKWKVELRGVKEKMVTNMNKLNQAKGVEDKMASNVNKSVEEIRGLKVEIIFIKDRVNKIIKMLNDNEREM